MYKIIFSLLLITSFLSDAKSQDIQSLKLIIFEGSDWCVNCRRLEKNILNDASFQNFLKKNAIEVEKIDFPQRKKLSKEQEEYNNAIADKYAFAGIYPTIILSKRQILIFEKIDYSNQSVKEMIEQIEQKIKRLQ
jgi:thioredoxin-related protein